MKIACPGCSQHIAIDAETLNALQDAPHFQCPSCGGVVPVPSVPQTKPTSPQVDQKRALLASLRSAASGRNRNLLVLGVVALLVLGGIAAFLASRSGGNIFNTVNNITSQIVNNNYFTQLILAGATTEKDLEAVADIRPQGDGFVGVSKKPLTWDEARALAQRTASEVFPLQAGGGVLSEEARSWLASNFADHLHSSPWVSDGGRAGTFDGKTVAANATPDIARPVLLRWMRSRAAEVKRPRPSLEDVQPLPDIVPAAWKAKGVVARIKGPGTMSFPSQYTSTYVLEIDLLIRNPKARVSIFSGEPQNGTEISLGAMTPQDNEQGRIPCRLFRVQPWGVNWFGEKFLEANQRLNLTLLASDSFKVLRVNGEDVLRGADTAVNLGLSITAQDGTDATIYRCQWRDLLPEDCKTSKLPLPLPQRDIVCDEEATEARIAAEVARGFGDQATPGQSFVVPGLIMPMKWIEPGEFTMGAPRGAIHPQHGSGSERVKFSKGCWIGIYEVTQAQWFDVMGSRPSRIGGSRFLPVNWVSWSDAREFCTRLTASERRAGRCPQGYEYRLPTEAEWEYACRAGSSDAEVIPAKAIPTKDNSLSSLVEAGASPPNAWGLHEMLGNVAEWCLDEWQPYRVGAQGGTPDRLNAPKDKLPEAMFVVRGGEYWNHGEPCNPFVRWRAVDVAGSFRGFRAVLGIERSEIAAFDQQRALAIIKALGGKHDTNATAPGQPLKNIDLSNSAVTDFDLLHLSHVATLESIQLAGTHVSDTAIAALQAALPKLSINR